MTSSHPGIRLYWPQEESFPLLYVSLCVSHPFWYTSASGSRLVVHCNLRVVSLCLVTNDRRVLRFSFCTLVEGSLEVFVGWDVCGTEDWRLKTGGLDILLCKDNEIRYAKHHGAMPSDPLDCWDSVGVQTRPPVPSRRCTCRFPSSWKWKGTETRIPWKGEGPWRSCTKEMVLDQEG